MVCALCMLVMWAHTKYMQFHQNKGVVGLRMDGIEDAVIVGLTVSNLVNESPLVSSACGSYSGPHDGGAPGTIEDAGGMGTDLRGIVMAGGDALIIGITAPSTWTPSTATPSLSIKANILQ